MSSRQKRRAKRQIKQQAKRTGACPACLSLSLAPVDDSAPLVMPVACPNCGEPHAFDPDSDDHTEAIRGMLLYGFSGCRRRVTLTRGGRAINLGVCDCPREHLTVPVLSTGR